MSDSFFTQELCCLWHYWHGKMFCMKAKQNGKAWLSLAAIEGLSLTKRKSCTKISVLKVWCLVHDVVENCGCSGSDI